MKIVFLHGLGQRAADWDRVASQFPNTDCPDLFETAGEKLNYAAILSSLEERYEHEKEPLCLCGLSLGGMLALDYALRHGDQVAAMVLLGARDRTPRLLMDIQDLLFRCMPDKAFASTGMKKEQVRDLTRSMKNLDFTDRLSTIHCPVTVACGEKDHPNLAAARRLAKDLPSARLYVVPHAGHELNTDAPDTVAEIVRESCRVSPL